MESPRSAGERSAGAVVRLAGATTAHIAASAPGFQPDAPALRPYQHDAVERLRAAYGMGHRAALLVAPTGAGKTVVFAFVAAEAVRRGRLVLILVHRRELIRQASAKLTAAGVAHGIIAPGHAATDDPVQVASVQTLARRLRDGRHTVPDLIVVDEAHHAVAGQWAKVIAAYPKAKILGVTATPERLDGRGLGVAAGGPFDALVLGPSVAELIAGGFLTPASIFVPAGGPDLSGVRMQGGDFARDALAEAMGDAAITGDAVEHYARHAAGLPAVAFCISVAHAEAVATAFRAAGWRAVAVSGATPQDERDAAIAGLGDGSVQVLCACDLISEGLDVPAIGAAILLRPTASLGLYLQQVGRGLRPAPGKDRLVILDHAGNALRHGLPDAPRRWSLDGRPKRERGKVAGTPGLRRCPDCAALNPIALPECAECGHEFRGRAVQERAGDLRELHAERIARLRATPLRRLLADVRSEADLREIALARGYRRGWVHHVMRERAASAARGVAA